MAYTQEDLHKLIRIHLRPAAKSIPTITGSQQVIQCPICKTYEPADWKDGSYFPSKPLKHKETCYWAKKKYQELLSNEKYMKSILDV